MTYTDVLKVKGLSGFVWATLFQHVSGGQWVSTNYNYAVDFGLAHTKPDRPKVKSNLGRCRNSEICLTT